jgi:hypothetical protein
MADITYKGGVTITTNSNGDIALTPNGTGDVELDGLNWPQADGTDGQVLSTDGAGQLSFVAPSGAANGLLYPSSVYIASSTNIWGDFYVGDGANAHTDDVVMVKASLGADAKVMLRFDMPPTLPTGTAKLRILGLADAVTGNAKVNPAWASVAVGEDPSSFTLTAEGTQTVTWSTNDDDEYQETKVTLDADTIVASEFVIMHVTFETSSWTLAVNSGWIFSIIWE